MAGGLVLQLKFRVDVRVLESCVVGRGEIIQIAYFIISCIAMGCKSPTQIEVFAEIEDIKMMLRQKKNDVEMTY